MKLLLTVSTRRAIIAVILIAIASVVLLSRLALVHSAAQQATKRSFENKIPLQVPLKVRIKKEKEEKALAVNNKNWFRDIEIEVTNTSDKPIYFLSLNLELPDLSSEGSGEIRAFLLRYGRTDFYEQDTKPLPDDVPIQPKATYTFVIDEKNRTGYEKWRAKDSRSDPLKLQISINHLSFGDGTGFTSMSAVPFPVKNNPEELGRCLKNARPPDESAKTPTLFSSVYARLFTPPAASVPVKFFPEADNAVDENSITKSRRKRTATVISSAIEPRSKTAKEHNTGAGPGMYS